MRTILGTGLVLAFALVAGAEDKKEEKVDGKLLVGKWKQYEPAKGAQLTAEFRGCTGNKGFRKLSGCRNFGGNHAGPEYISSQVV